MDFLITKATIYPECKKQYYEGLRASAIKARKSKQRMKNEYLRKVAELNLCDSCFNRYKALIEPSIKDLLFNPMEDWREVESDITLMVMVIEGVLEPDNIYLSLGDGPILFEWNQNPLRRNGRLIKFLKQTYNIDWVKTAKIKNIKGEKTIKLSTEEHSLSLRLNDEETIVSLKIDDGRTDEFIVKKEKKNLNIYKKDKEGKEINYEDFFKIKKIDYVAFENIMSYWGFTQKIDYLHRKEILRDFSHRVLDEANQVRNKIHNPPIVTKFSEQNLILFQEAREITYAIYRATMDGLGEEKSTELKDTAEEYAKQCLLKLNYEW